MYFAVQGMFSPARVSPNHYVSIQHSIEMGRADLDAEVPEEVERRYGRLRPMPDMPAGLAQHERLRVTLSHVLEQIDSASFYISIPAEDLPGFIWELFAEGKPVVFVWQNPESNSGNFSQYVVVPVLPDLARGASRLRQACPGA